MRQNSVNGPGSPAATRHSRSSSYAGKPSTMAARSAAALKLAEAMNARYERDDDEVEDGLETAYNPTSRYRSMSPGALTIAKDSSPAPRPSSVLSKETQATNPYLNQTNSSVSTWAHTNANGATSRIVMESSPTPGLPLIPTGNSRRSLRPTSVAAAPIALSNPRTLTSNHNMHGLPNKTPERYRRPSVDFNAASYMPTNLDVVQHPQNTRREVAELSDQVDLLQDEKTALLEKLHAMESQLQHEKTRSQELEKQFEKQGAILGNGVSMEARHQQRLEQAMKYRSEAVRAAKGAVNEEVAALREQLSVATNVAKEMESEVRVLRTVAQRISLSREEKQDLTLKRCWLARYWDLANKHGIHGEIAHERLERYSSLVPHAMEIVLSAANEEKSQEAEANEDSSEFNSSVDGKRAKFSDVDANDAFIWEGTVEEMLFVERDMVELNSLNIEQAVVLAMARRPGYSIMMHHPPSLTPEEEADIKFKRAWLVYFWRRAKHCGVQEEIADEKLFFWSFWNNNNNNSSNSLGKEQQKILTAQDMLEVGRGLTELRKEGVENQLWLKCRKERSNKFMLPNNILDTTDTQKMARSLSAGSSTNGN